MSIIGAQTREIDIADQISGGDGLAGALIVEKNMLVPSEKAQREDIVGCDALGQGGLQVGQGGL
jgi:hypothetical protein